LEEDARRVRKERNRFTHEGGVSADLEHTLRAISVVRMIASKGVQPQSPRWHEPTGQAWDQTLTKLETIAYLDEAGTAISEARNAGRKCRGNIWVNAVRQRMPTEFEGLPIDMISKLYDSPDLDDPPIFRDLIPEILKRSLDPWINSLTKPDRLGIPKPVQDIIQKFNELNMEDVGVDIAKRFLSGIPSPQSLEGLTEELGNASLMEGVISTPDLRVRWKRAIKDKQFSSTIDELAGIDNDSFDILGGPGIEDLFRKSLDNSVLTVKGGDVSGVKQLCDAITSLNGLSDKWEKPLKSSDGFISDRVSRKIRSGDDIIASGILVEKMMPIINAEMFPKTNAQFENIISAGEKAKKKAEVDKK